VELGGGSGEVERVGVLTAGDEKRRVEGNDCGWKRREGGEEANTKETVNQRGIEKNRASV
jgi:hypothetical protein